MCQLAYAVAIAHSEHARNIGFETGIDSEPPATDVESGFGCTVRDNCPATDSHQHSLGFDALHFPFSGEIDLLQHPVGRLHRHDFGRKVEFHPTALQGGAQTFRYILVERRQDFLAIFYHCDLRTQSRKHRGEFHPDYTSTDNGKRLRKCRGIEQFGRGDSQFGSGNGKACSLRAGSDNDFRGRIHRTAYRDFV